MHRMLRRVVQGVEHGEGMSTRQAEHGPHALQFQGSNDGLSTPVMRGTCYLLARPMFLTGVS